MNYIIYGMYLLQLCTAHISMSSPPSRRNYRSTYYANAGLVDYDLRTPLEVAPNHFSFPCKGFPKGPSVFTFPNKTVSVTLEGTAVHGGGHCQFGVSYDNKNFVVLKTVYSDCLLDTMTYDFDIPNDAPGGDITLFWTWINRIGNREYYMECTDVTVNDVPKSTSGKKPRISGTELLIVNLQGYPRVPEWNVGDSPDIDGRTLLSRGRKVTFDLSKRTVRGGPKTTGTSQVITYASTTTIANQNATLTTIDTTETSQVITYASTTTIANQNATLTTIEPCETTHAERIRTERSGRPERVERPERIECNQINEGKMKCEDNGFKTCNHGAWVYRDCAVGTICKAITDSIVCV